MRQRTGRARSRSANTKSSLIGFILIFFAGAGILFYPRISFWLADHNHSVAHQTYTRSVANLTAQEKQALWEGAVYYNERLVDSVVEDPFANTEDLSPFDEYYDTLDIGGGVMGYIHIPDISVLLPIYHGVGDEVLDKGVGHIHATALPVGGEGTHAVLTGHTGLSHAKMFDELVKLKYGEEFYLEVLDETLAYQIISIEVVLPDDVSSLQREAGQDKVTLVTCTPYGVNSHRLLVTGERIPYTGGLQENREKNQTVFPWWILVVVLGMMSLVFLIGKKIRAGKQKTNKHSAIEMRDMAQIAKEELTKAIREDVNERKT